LIRTTEDIRPGLLITFKQQRLHNQMKKKKEHELLNKSSSIKVLEEQQRQEGLEKAIDSKNKGFSLLQKMGYQPGSGIGKNSKEKSAKILILHVDTICNKTMLKLYSSSVNRKT